MNFQLVGILMGAFAIDVRDGVDTEAIFSDFVGIQISGVATNE